VDNELCMFHAHALEHL